MKVIFLDRDGVINKYPGDFQYVKTWEEFKFLPRVKASLKRLSLAGFKIFVISNQAGVSKGIYSKRTLDLITEKMLKSLGCGVKISGVYYCTHQQDENCNCRKPKTGLVELAINNLKKEGAHILLDKSFFVGDTIRDVQTGKRAGLKTILVFSGREKPENKDTWQALPDYAAKDLSEAVKIILK